MKENFKLYIYETKIEYAITSNIFNVKTRIEAILGVAAKDKAATAACFREEDNEPLMVIYKTASGEFAYYLPEQI